ncbi:thermonuclease family protein [Paenibacillus sp. YYML68]|uniref:thermonuclease family protein n=1 Tax=Paenibacillus sp. YYML68 TaxID=2909250 RepID=UPI0024934430|nr:thermonuclease family protein [Paenibacillus sp. YYML68]
MTQRNKRWRRKAVGLAVKSALSLSVLFSSMAGTAWAEADHSAPLSSGFEPTAIETASVSSYKTIAEARQQKTGSVTVRGEVVAVYPKSNAYIHDGTAGLRIYGNEGAGLTLNSEIEITGTLVDYNGDLELKYPFTINTLSGNTYTPPAPLEVSVSQVGTANQGQLVKVKNVWITGNYNSGDGGVNVTDGTGSLVVYALDQPALKSYLQGLPTGESNKFDIVGASSVFRSTVQMFPRGQSDIMPAGTTGEQYTPAPNAAFLTFSNENPAAAKLTGLAGAAAASSTVNIYTSMTKDNKLGTVQADAAGAFSYTFNNSATKYSSLYVTAKQQDKLESGAVSVMAVTPGEEWYEATVTHITDGDTFNISPALQINGQSVSIVRMLSIDTPEVAQAPHGDMATGVLKSLISTGSQVKLRLDHTKVDVYGRLLAHVFRKSDNLDVNKEMLRQGAAINYYIYPNMMYFEEYGAAARQAATEGKGIWNPSNPLQKLPYEYRAAGCPERYVADYRTKKYVVPKRYTEIPFEHRVFFGYDKQEAKAAGYTPLDPADPSHNPATDCSTGQLKTIADVRSNWNTNDTYQVIAEVTAVHAPDHAFVQDGTGGIHLYGKVPDSLAVGQEVRVDGSVQEFYGDLEFKNARIEVLQQDQIPTPQPMLRKLNQIDESTEGSLVEVRDVWITGNYSGGNGGVNMTDSTGATVVLYSPTKGGPFLSALHALPKGQAHKFNVIGNGSVWSSTREIYPRSLADIVPAGQQSTKGTITGTVKAQGRASHDVIDLVAVHTATGSEKKAQVAANGSFTLTELEAGTYTLRATLKHYVTVQMTVQVAAGQTVQAGNVSAYANGGTQDGMMRAGNTYGGDQQINIYDAVIVGANMNVTSTAALSAADVNGDGFVNMVDLDLVKSNFMYMNP